MKFVVAVIAAVVLLAACGSSSQAPTATAPTPAGNATKVSVVISDDGCTPTPATIDAGLTEFDLSNSGSTTVTDAQLKTADDNHILGERENVDAGQSDSFRVRLASGKYKIVCANAKQDSWDFTVRGAALTGDDWHNDPELVAATNGYAVWVKNEVSRLATNTTAFVDAIKAGNLEQAKERYAQARLGYEAVEPVAEAFGALDKLVDGRISDFVDPSQFGGFHRLEKAVFVDKSVAGMTPIADALERNIAKLQNLVATLAYTPLELASGATDLVNEIEETKITGEEERYSGIDLVDFRGNLDGAIQVVDQFTPYLRQHAPALLNEFRSRSATVETTLAKYAATPGYVNSGYVNYDTVTTPQRRALSQVINALAASIAEMVVVVTK